MWLDAEMDFWLSLCMCIPQRRSIDWSIECVWENWQALRSSIQAAFWRCLPEKARNLQGPELGMAISKIRFDPALWSSFLHDSVCLVLSYMWVDFCFGHESFYIQSHVVWECRTSPNGSIHASAKGQNPPLPFLGWSNSWYRCELHRHLGSCLIGRSGQKRRQGRHDCPTFRRNDRLVKAQNDIAIHGDSDFTSV